MVGGYDAFDFECIFADSECFIQFFIIVLSLLMSEPMFQIVSAWE